MFRPRAIVHHASAMLPESGPSATQALLTFDFSSTIDITVYSYHRTSEEQEEL
jgi:hypothetical protein